MNTASSPPVLPDEIAATLVDPEAYADIQRISDTYTWLRQNMPFGIAKPVGFDPFWVVTKHADILEVSKNNKAFHNGDRATILTDQYTDAIVRHLRNGSPHLARTLSHMDDPDHRKYRSLTNSWFMAPNLVKREEGIRQIACDFVERMLSHGGTCDFVKDVAEIYPLRIIMQILDVPVEDEPLMLQLTRQVFGSLDEDLNRSGKAKQTAEEALLALNGAVEAFFKYFDAVTQDRRANPRDDLATAIANGMIDGKLIGSFEAMSYYAVISTAGHDTVTASLAGGALALCQYPDELAKVKANPSLIPGLVEEAIRWTTPIRHFMRTATTDYRLRDQNIAAGDWLMLCYFSGNRDEDVFEDPFSFRIDRAPNKQLAFGSGAHMCLGQHLARMDMRTFFEELLPRVKSLSLSGEPDYSKAVFVGGLKELPIRFEVA